MSYRLPDNAVAGASALAGLLVELAAADELITELVAENEELRARLAGIQPATVRGCM
jgi:hypothetical protein